MTQGTFSVQVKPQERVERLTRTQRQQISDEQRRYLELKAEAERLRTQVFISTQDNPFTFDEYTSQYQNMSPDLQQFFYSPTEIQSKQQQDIQANRNVFNQKISEIQTQIEKNKTNEQNFKDYYNKNPISSNYQEQLDWYYINNTYLENKITYAKEQENKLNEGVPVQAIFNYADDQARVLKDKSEANAQFKRDLVSGKFDTTLETLGVKDVEKRELTLPSFQSKIESYNMKAKQIQGIKKYATQLGGYENLPEVSKQVLLGDEKYKEYLNQKTKDEELTTEAQALLKEKGFGEGTSLYQQDMNLWEKIWTGLKTGYLSSILGTQFSGVSETEQKRLTELREQRIKESVIPQINPITFLPEIPLYKLGVQIPLKTSWKALEEQRGLDYKAKQSEKLLKQLTGLQGVSNELDPYILSEGYKILETKGLKMTKTKELTGLESDEFGNITPVETVTTTITDPAFDRRLSQNMLEWENELSKKDKNYLNIGLLGTRIVSTKATETYFLTKGIKGGIGLVSKGYKWATGGLTTLEGVTRTGTFAGEGVLTQTPKFMKTIQLQEAVATVPRDFKILKTTATIGLTGLYGYSKYQQYKSYTQTSPYGKSLFWLETAGELGGFELATGMGRNAVNKALTKIENIGLKERKLADISEEGFWRENKRLGMDEKVYMERYKGFKLKQPKSWLQTLKGYEKGQFTGWERKLFPDEVSAYYKYGGKVTLTYPSGKVRVVNPEAFPMDALSTYVQWFNTRNIQEYGVGSYSKLPINVRGKAMGYSATGEEWIGTDFATGKIYYYEKGIVKSMTTKGAIQFFSGKGVSVGFLRIFKNGMEESVIGKTATKPIIYSGYFDKMKVNKAIKEVRGWDLSGREIKAYIYPKDTGQAGTLNIPLSKREVEGTVEISTRIPIRRAFKVKLAGWSVPIQEEVLSKVSELSPSTLRKIVRSMGSVNEIEGVAFSSLPSRAVSSQPPFSIISYPKKSSSYSSSMSSIMSKISRVSEVSEPSTPSSVSKSSASSKSSSSSFGSSAPSSISSIVSQISNISYSPSSPRRNPPSQRYSSPPVLSSQLRGLIKSLTKQPKTPKLMALLPDFTSRAIGLKPKKVSVKQALKEMRKIQTGLEVRTGARIKGYTPIDEKSLLKGIMK